jgi:heparan-alpha-glucosaminide N-acetyltransferase
MDRPTRVLSIDLLRGADVWLMLFVNEMAGVKATPAFLRHMPASADGMTITDVVFPAFLFITGMAIPLALGARLRRGDSRGAVWRHVLGRTAVLLVLGVLMINAEHASANAIIPPALWNVLMTAAVVLVFAVPAQKERPHARRAWQLAGLALLLVLILVYRADGISGAIQIRPYWWGILGLIGWAYLVAAALYLVAGDRPAILVAAVALLYLVALADEAGAVGALGAIRPFVSVGSMLGAHGALVLSGTVLTVALIRHRGEDRPAARFIAPALGFALACAAAGLLVHALHGVHPVFEISKIRATVAWCLLSAAFTVAAWTPAYASADVAGHRRWPRTIAMAGENALLIYLLAPFLLSVFDLVAWGTGRNPYEALGGSLAAGLVRSVVFAWAIVRLSGWMRGRGLRLQL